MVNLGNKCRVSHVVRLGGRHSEPDLLFRYIFLSIILISLFIIIVCAGTPDVLKHPLYFINPSQSDTTNYFNVKSIQPFYIELTGSAQQFTDSTYRILVFIGIIGSPEFVESKLDIYPDSININTGVIKLRGEHSALEFPYENRPYDALSTHFFLFSIDDLKKQYNCDQSFKFTIKLDKYIKYGGVDVDIKPITILDPWFIHFCKDL